MSTCLVAAAQEVFIESVSDLLWTLSARRGLRQRCLGLTALSRHHSAQSHERQALMGTSHLAGHQHPSILPHPSSTATGLKAHPWNARQNYKGQISTLHSTQRGSVLCTAAAALTEQALSNGAGAQQMRGLAQEACAAGHLSEDGTAFLEEHRIRGYEVGPDQQTTIVTMANLLQVPGPICFHRKCHL